VAILELDGNTAELDMPDSIIIVAGGDEFIFLAPRIA